MLESEEKEFKRKIKSKDGKRPSLQLNNTRKSMINGLPKRKQLPVKPNSPEKLLKAVVIKEKLSQPIKR